jgi:eukaryotic-like serine/threonine-protein kinase
MQMNTELASDHAGDEHELSVEGSTWHFVEGVEIAPGYYAWDLLSIGRRFEMWIAWCASRLTPVCVKLPRKDELNARTVAALQREYQAASSMSHPAIPRVFEANIDADVPYIIHEFIEGKPLSLVLDDDGKFDPHDVIFLGLQLAAALRHVHNQGYVHLDLKPANVSIRGDRALLLDFDIALPIGGQRSTTRPRGTRHYMAPEQIRCEPAQPSMDLFALGTLLYEVASNQKAFRLDTADEPSHSSQEVHPYRQIQAPIASIGELVPDLGPSIAAVIDALMAIDVAARPATADDTIKLLEAALPPDQEEGPLWPAWVTDTVLSKPGRPLPIRHGPA